MDKCTHEDIKSNAERIYLEVFGHPFHHCDAPLFFAKMLYMQFIQGEDVDLSSKDIVQNVHDIRGEIVTFTQEELNFALKGVALELQVHTNSLLEWLNQRETEA